MTGTNTKRKRDTPHHSSFAVKKQKLLESRKQLPIWKRAQDIRDCLQDQHVLVLSGETGSGKSTQVPQFLLESSWCTGKIAVTQPRRVAAISLARRVAEEMGSPLGSSSPASTVGYSVRFDESTSPSTRIKFLTEGMLLQEMLRDPLLSQYSCVIVDEVHERSVNVDLLVGFLKQLVHSDRRKSQLKVVVMSATAKVKKLSRFFSDTAPSQTTGVTGPEHRASTCQIEGRQYPVKVNYLSRPTDQVIDAALERIFRIHCHEPMPGDILVFLTGQETIQGLQKLVEDLAEGLPVGHPKILALPLYAALPQAAQQRIFDKAPPFTRKVILSTNIAETSVTVPGVRYVVDTGKAKFKHFRNNLGLDTLLIQPISRSSADQRKGRAGREAPGQCFRLFTEGTYARLKKQTKPEISRCDLSSALLVLTARGVDNVFDFPYLTPPRREAILDALMHLYQLKALDESFKINAMGRKIARLPLTPTLGRVVLEAAKPERDCLLEVIDIVACLSVENILLNPGSEEEREQAQEARSQLIHRQGDHLMLLATVQAYAAEHADRRRWANERSISHRAMQNVMAVRKQLTALCKHNLRSDPTVRTTADEATQENILKCFLCGYWNQMAWLRPDKSYRTLMGEQTVTIHPSSILFGRKTKVIMYNEFVYTKKAYVKGVSAMETKWLEEVKPRWLDHVGINGGVGDQAETS